MTNSLDKLKEPFHTWLSPTFHFPFPWQKEAARLPLTSSTPPASSLTQRPWQSKCLWKTVLPSSWKFNVLPKKRVAKLRIKPQNVFFHDKQICSIRNSGKKRKHEHGSKSSLLWQRWLVLTNYLCVLLHFLASLTYDGSRQYNISAHTAGKKSQ